MKKELNSCDFLKSYLNTLKGELGKGKSQLSNEEFNAMNDKITILEENLENISVKYEHAAKSKKAIQELSKEVESLRVEISNLSGKIMTLKTETAQVNWRPGEYVDFGKPSSVIFEPCCSSDETKEERYNKIKDRLNANISSKSKVNITFDDENCTITFNHGEKEIRGIIDSLPRSVQSSFPKKISVVLEPRNYAVVKGMQVSQDSVNNAKENINNLLNESRTSLNDVSSEQVRLAEATTEKTWSEQLMQNYDGFCLGEKHEESKQREWLFDNMGALKLEGLTTLYMEHIFYDTTQQLLDEYMSDPNAEEMPKILESHLNNMDKDNFRSSKAKSSLLSLVKEAKKQGVRVVGIDTTTSYLCGYDYNSGIKDSDERYLGMNITSQKIIQNEQRNNPGKFIALMGSAHVGRCEGVPGVADLMGVPSVIMSESSQVSTMQIQRNVVDYKDSVSFVSLVVDLPI